MGAPLLAVHGHFYQPPRENPWTEAVAREPSAAPAHDWNARIAAESYRPNGWARIVDDHGRIVAIVNNYERLSFNVGPTLLSWLEAHAPDTYERIRAADASKGRALAQAYGHMILPLANDRDVRTQIRWGRADFVHRFGRAPAGMWLPETALNDRVLAILADEGIGFTVIAPGQALAVRPLTGARAGLQPALPIEGGPGGPDGWDEGWHSVAGGTIDAGRTYRWRHPDRADVGVDIVVYDGELAHAVAFGLSGLSSGQFLDQVTGDPGRAVVVVAADGETFGHHHTYGDRLAAHALAVEAPGRGIEVVGLAELLERCPPDDEIRVAESSWSCSHGVGRWREDCGCSTGGRAGSNQAWRAPLRAALDWLRDRAVAVFEELGATVFDDPWAARDAYIDVVLGAADRDAWTEQWVTGDPVVALALLESQRHAMAMYTSCGWFFHDLAGIETIQVLRYAARCLDLLREVGRDPGEDAFLDLLAEARSNDPDEGDGRAIWARHVAPARVDEARAVAELALEDLLEARPPGDRVAAWDVEVVSRARLDRGGLTLAYGQLALTHRRTGRRSERVYAGLHLAGFEVFGASRPVVAGAAPPGAPGPEGAFEPLRSAFEAGTRLTTLLRLVAEGFGPDEFGLDAALPDAGERIMARAASDLAARFAAAYEQLYGDHRDTLDALAAAGYPLPPVLRAPAELALARRIESEVAAQHGSLKPDDYATAINLARQARDGGFDIDTPDARLRLGQLLAFAAERVDSPDPAARREAAAAGLVLLDVAQSLELHPDVDRAQELVFAALRSWPDAGQDAVVARLAERVWLAPADRLLDL